VKKILLALALLASSTCAFATNWALRAGVALDNAQNRIGGAQITICVYNAGLACTTQTTVYSDAALTVPITQPLTADGAGNYQYYVSPGTQAVETTVWSGGTTYRGIQVGMIGSSSDTSSSGTDGSANSGNSHVLGKSLPENLSPTRFSSIRIAENFPGADCGAKINAADADLGTSSGMILVNNACGMAWSTLVTLNANHSLNFIQGGTYTTSAGVVLSGAYAAIDSALSSAAPGPTTIQAASWSYLTTLVAMNQATQVIHNINLDGNKVSGGTAASGQVLSIASAAGRATLDHVQVINGADKGISYKESGNLALDDVEVNFNAHQGLYCEFSNDTYITGNSQFTYNGWSGLELSGCSSLHFSSGNISFNGAAPDASPYASQCSLYIHGFWTGSAEQMAQNNTFTNQFDPNTYQDICEIGTDAAHGYAQATGLNSYNGNFIGGAGTTPLVYLLDTRSDLFSGTMQLGSAPFGIDVEMTGNGRTAESIFHMAFAPGITMSSALHNNTDVAMDLSGSSLGSSWQYPWGPIGSCAGGNSILMTCDVTSTNPWGTSGVLGVLDPLLNSGGYSISQAIGLDRVNNYNSTQVSFVNQGGSGSPTNKACFGLKGAKGLCLDGGGNMPSGAITGSLVVSVSALSTPTVVFDYAASGLLAIRDNTMGGSAAFLIDPNGGAISIANQITGLGGGGLTYSGGSWRITLTSGTVPRSLQFMLLAQ
jgi:hypothetical protein